MTVSTATVTLSSYMTALLPGSSRVGAKTYLIHIRLL